MMTICVNINCELKIVCGRHRYNNEDNHVNAFTSCAYFDLDDEKNCRFFIDMNKNENDYELLKNIPC